MPRITIDGKSIECKDRQIILQACLDAGQELPHYCYHPGLSIPASCRICLVEVEGIPKLVPSCQTPVRDGMVVHSKSPKAVANQTAVMEYLLVNHPLDCPVCDQAGECDLQDYSYHYGRSESRFEEDKIKNPKKDIGEHVLLYGDRCIMCTRCVRFTREISGTSELLVEGRGAREEINIFPGKPLNNKLSGNVVDLCPVGALLEKEFLFKQRVWLLKATASISPVDSGGENIWLNHNEGVIYRIKPRYNPKVNQWWISDDTRLSYKPVHDKARLRGAHKVQYGTQVETNWQHAVELADEELNRIQKENGDGALFAMLSPMMACEEAYLLGKYLRSIDPQTVLVLGPVPRAESDEVFKNPATDKITFTIQAEKVPNRKGIERVMSLLGGPTMTLDELSKSTKHKAGWIVGGYLSNWVTDALKLPKTFKIVQDILPNKLSDTADVLLPAASWAEKDGCWENFAGKIQVFEAGIPPVEGARREGDVYLNLLGRSGMYSAAEIRKEMGEPFDSAATPKSAEEEPAFEFAPL
jgi:NADH-quinone oxidoreductase subunit G